MRWGDRPRQAAKRMVIMGFSFVLAAHAWYGVKPDETVANARAAL
jgi:hypothetical protein